MAELSLALRRLELGRVVLELARPLLHERALGLEGEGKVLADKGEV